MAKTIKFNLILNEKQIRNLTGLQDNFDIDDILKYYKSGLLLRWLDVREYHKEHEAVKDIDSNLDDTAVIKELIKIFEIELDDSVIDREISILSYAEKEKEQNEIYAKNSFEKRKIIDDYHSGYDLLIQHMIENKDNMALLKADVTELEKQYARLFKLDHQELYFRISKEAPKAVFAILTKDIFRDFWIGKSANVTIYSDIKSKLLPKGRLKKILGDDLRIEKRDTQQMWDPIERKEVKIMALNIEPGTFIKNAGEFSEKLSANDINAKFVLLNGLEYQCNDASYELLYMEV